MILPVDYNRPSNRNHKTSNERGYNDLHFRSRLAIGIILQVRDQFVTVT
jgi:hypothetical protein